MITIHAARADDFASLGYGALQPTEAAVEEHAGGMYQLTMTHPMDAQGRWWDLVKYNIIKAPAPVRETPRIVIDGESTPGKTVTREIYKVKTPHGGRLRLRKKPSLSAKVISLYKPGTKVVRLSVSGSWARVAVCKGGATGYMWSDYLAYVSTQTETTPGKDVPGRVIEAAQTQEQLFRISRVEKDDEAGAVRVTALHISYDLSGNAIKGALELDSVAADEAVARVLAQANDEHPFEVYCAVKEPVSGDFTGKSVAAALWGDGGIVEQTGARLVRDNYSIYILPDEERDRGVEIRHGKNLIGAIAYEDAADIRTRIIPVGADKNGNRLTLEDPGYVESPRAAEIPVIRSREVEYDVQVGKNGISTAAQARAKLRELAEADFAAGADAPVVGLDVDFVQLENTEEYARYAGLQSVHLYDTVHVISGPSDIRAGVRMTGYVYDVASDKPRYSDVTLGQITEMESALYGYDLAEGSTPGTKLLNGSVGGEKMRNASIQYAKIAQAAIEQLTANSITAVRAHINELVAGSITTDQLYADLATLAAAQITAANIEKANIDWAAITTLRAEIATIAQAQITTATIKSADIDWAQIDTLTAKMAEIAQARIDNAEITAAQIKDLEAVVATIFAAKIGSADIGFAQIKDLVAGTAIITEGVGGQLYIARLAVTEANMVSLTVGELIVKGEDGGFYALGVDADGNVRTTVKQIANSDVQNLSINAGEKLIEGSVTAACLNAKDIFADNAIIRQMIAANIDVGTLFAREAFIAHLNTSDISGNEYLKLTVKEAVDGIAVGGRNLLRNTQEFTPVEGNSVLTGEKYLGLAIRSLDTTNMTSGLKELARWTDAVYPEYSEEYVVSFYAKGAGELVAYFYSSNNDSSVRPVSSKGSAGSTTVLTDGRWTFPLTDEWTRYWVAYKMAETGDKTIAKNVMLRLFYGNTASVCGVKLEKGNKATDWSPAPEDIESDVSALEQRVSTAEQKITADAIVSTVTSSTSYKTLSNTVETAQSTANTAKSTADTAKTKADGNAIDITGLKTRMTTAESKIDQKADSITLSVLEMKVDGIAVGGRNYILESGEYDPITGNGGGAQDCHIFKIADAFWSNDERIDSNIVFSFDWEWNTGLPGAMNSLIAFGTSPYYNTKFQFPAGQKTGHVSLSINIPTLNYTTDHLFIRLVNVSSSYNLTIRNAKLEVGNKSTDWSPAPEDPAQGLVIGSSVEITKDRVRILSQETSIAIPSADSEDGEEIASFDENGLTAQEATFDTVHSDSVVSTQASATLTPANAGELQAILDNLSCHFMTGTVTIDCSGVQGGTFTLRGLSGGYPLNLNDLTANSLTVARCTARIYLYRPSFSTSGTALTVSDAKVYIGDGTIDAATGVYVGEWGEVKLANCSGTTTTLLNVDYGATAHVSGTEVGVSVPYGLKTGAGDAYSSVAFKAAQSPVETPTVTTAELGATSTKTWCGSWKSGNGLYQGRYISSDSTYRRGCMWFNLSAITGKEIVSASLKIKRYSGVGGGGSVTVNLYGTTAASASGTPGVGTKYASVAIANGQTKTVDVTAAVKALAAGTIKGLMIYDSQSGTFSSGKYTYGYCRLYGSDAADKPVLSVTYK